MKYLKQIGLTIATAFVALFGSCSSDDLFSGTDEIKGVAVPVTLTVERGETTTRTLLTETDKGGLNNFWKEGDKVFLYNSDGLLAGSLLLKSGEKTSTGVFDGEVIVPDNANGPYTFKVFHYDDKATYPIGGNSKKVVEYNENTKKLSLKIRTYTSLEDLSEMDILSSTIDLNVAGGKAVVSKKVDLNAHLAMVRFSLPESMKGKSGQLAISQVANLDNGGMKTGVTFNMANGSVSQSQGRITGKVEANKDFFVALYPGKYTLHFDFVEDNGKVYTADFKNQSTVEAGVYYNGFPGEGTAIGSELPGIVIPFEEKNLAYLHLIPNFDGSQNKNDTDKIIYSAPFQMKDNGELYCTFDLNTVYDYYEGNCDRYFENGSMKNCPTNNVGKHLPANDGYEFAGWFTTEGTTEGTSKTVTINNPSMPNVYFYARWEKAVVPADRTANPFYATKSGEKTKRWQESNFQTTSFSAGYTPKGSFTA